MGIRLIEDHENSSGSGKRKDRDDDFSHGPLYAIGEVGAKAE
jgi:hypothetical protein